MGDNIPLQNKKPSIGELLRTGSCTGDPQTNALNCLKSRDLTIFSDIINEIEGATFPLPDDHWLNQPLAEEDDKTLLMVAIDGSLHSFITVLLQAGASARLTNQMLGKAPIHSAVQAGDLRALRELFNHEGNQADVNSTVRINGRTSLHICAEKGLESCLKFLLEQKGIQVDVADKKFKQTPLFLVGKSNSPAAAAMARALIEGGADVSRTCLGKTVGEHLKENIPGFDPSAVRRPQQPSADESESMLRRMAEIIKRASITSSASREALSEFKSLREKVDHARLKSFESGGGTLLQTVALENLPEFAEILLNGDSGVDPDGTTETKRITPLLIAANCRKGTGCAQMIKLLAQHGADFAAVTPELKETVLHIVLKGGNRSCLDFLLGEEGCPKIRNIINRRDLTGNTVELIFVAFLCFVLFGASTPSSVDRVLWTALLILTAVLLMREIFQVFVSLKRYLVSPENWLEMTVIILVSVIIFHDHEGEDGDSLHRHLSAVVIVLSWSELITLVGKHPKLTRYNVYVMMLYKVMGSFFSFLCWYAFFIVAFGLGFYIMLHKVKEEGGLDEEKETGKEGDEYVFFNSPWLALVKTSTMFVGELEFSDIPINLESPLSPLAYVYFLSFVFLIVVVLMNLLNGLAVSDTGAIQAKAEIVSYISRVDTISYTESILLGDPFNFLSNWPALRWLRSLPSCSFCGQLYRHRGIQKLFHKITGATGILLFYNLLPNKKLTLTPNAKRQECQFLQVELMDEDIISSVKGVILKKNAANQTGEMEERIKTMEMKLDLLLSKFK